MKQWIVATLALASVSVTGCRDDALAPTPEFRASAAPTSGAAALPTRGIIPGQYVVLFRRERVARHAGATTGVTGATMMTAANDLAVGKLAGGRGVLRRAFGYAIQGFVAQLGDSAVAALRTDPDVALIEPDRVVSIAASGIESSAPWGLDRIDQGALPLDGLYHYGNDGTGTSVYIIDTGINFTHSEFGGRAVTGRDFVTPNGTAADCHGHGTHVAGIVGGATYGVAKNVRLVAARVLDCSGSGSESGVIAALDWVAQQKGAAPATPMVVNMSLGGDSASALDSAVARTVAAGVAVVVAAGNSAADACTVSPARAPSAITVGATDASDRFASFSNYGSCVDISAPGVSVVSAYIGSNMATATMSGTSMASPHVAGAAALYLTANPAATPGQVVAALTANASIGAITGLPANTPSRLLYTGVDRGASVSTATTLIGHPASGLCLAVQNGAQSELTPFTLSTCASGSPAQQWTLPTVGNAGPMTVYNGSLCADDWGARGRVGDQVGTWRCVAGAPTQVWGLDAAGSLKGVNGLCTAVSPSGTTIVLQACDGSAAQRWTMGAPTSAPTRFTATLTSGNSGLCMAVEGGTSKSLARAVLAACNSTSAEMWNFAATATAGLVSVFNGAYCLDDWGARAQAGDQLGTYQCVTGAPTQTWTLTSNGTLLLNNGLCVAVNGAVASGTSLILQACNGSAGQQWTAASATTSSALSNAARGDPSTTAG